MRERARPSGRTPNRSSTVPSVRSTWRNVEAEARRDPVVPRHRIPLRPAADGTEGGPSASLHRGRTTGKDHVSLSGTLFLGRNRCSGWRDVSVAVTGGRTYRPRMPAPQHAPAPSSGPSVRVRLVRHGETVGYATDAGLTSRGRRQVSRAAHHLAGSLYAARQVALVHSPRARAIETARA